VVSADSIASRVGVNILQQGGNAIDAAIATAFTLAVTYPTAGNIGGGGFMIIRDSSKRVYALDYRETAPAKATKNMYLDSTGKVIKDASIRGYLAAGVPGTVCGMWEAHKKFGTLKWAEILKPAIRLAANGFALDEYKARIFNAFKQEFQQFPATAQIFVNPDGPFTKGYLFKQTDLARTLKRIARLGVKGFYSGPLAEKIAKDMQSHGGLISLKDLKSYRCKWRTPIQIDYRHYAIYTMPPPSSGGVVLAEILNTLEGFHLHRLGHNSSNMIRLWVETERYAYADRAFWLGDADFVTMPLNVLLSKEYGRKLRCKLHYFNAGVSDSIHPSLPNFKEKDQTTHFSIVDQWGNAVSNTFTLNGSFGSMVVVPGTGVLLNNEMDDFSIKPGQPNSYGLLGGYANAIQPGKRMLSSMTPAVVTHHDSLFMVLGSPGGAKIITTVAQVISNIIDYRMNIRQAIEAPRFHFQWKPDSLVLEYNRFNSDTIHNLLNAGYAILYDKYMGYVQGILIENRSSSITGWSDPRSNGRAIGY